jgi:hypothetical protein
VLGSPRSDMLVMLLPWRMFGFGEMARGNLALWNPHLFSGRPFLGDFQSALLYPPNLVHLLLPPRIAINVTIVFHVWLAGVLTLAWARRRGLGRPAATLAGLVTMFGAPLLLRVEAGHLTHVCAIPWTPAVLLCLDEAIRPREGGTGRQTAAWLLAAMAATALQVLGHPQYAYYTALVSLLFALAHVAVPALARPGRVTPRRRAWPLLAWGLAWAGGAALAAAQLGGGLEAALESGRWQETSQGFSATFSLPLENLATLVAPHVFGGGGQAYFGRWYAWEVTLFAGAATLVLAALARGRRARLEWALVAIALVLALGSELPTFAVAYAALPGFGLFRAPARLAAAALPLLALLAARGLDETLRTGPPRAAAPMVALGAAAVAALGWLPGTSAWSALLAHMQTASVREVPAAVLGDPRFAAAARALTMRQLFLAAAVLAACAALLAVARRRPAAAHGLAVLAALELVSFARAHRASSPPVMPYPAAWREAAREAGEARVRHTRESFANQGMIWGHLDVWGYDATVPARYAALIQAVDAAAERDGESAPALRGVVAMLRWRYLFGVTPQGQAGVVTVGEPLPHAVLVESATVLPDRAEMLRALLSPEFDPWRRVLLETAPEPPPVPAVGAPGQVRLIASDTDRLDFEVDTPRSAVLLVTDSYSRGWRAVALGPSPQARYVVLPANVALRAVPLAAGHHLLRLEYAPDGFRAGLVISVLALLGWLAAAVGIARGTVVSTAPGP